MRRYQQTPLLESEIVVPDPERIYLGLSLLFNAEEKTMTLSQKAATQIA
jgi:hypothetical protein